MRVVAPIGMQAILKNLHERIWGFWLSFLI